mgnify:CR=1 FL=1
MLKGEGSAVKIEGNSFMNLKYPCRFDDTGTTPGLTFRKNFVYNWENAILAQGPYIDVDDNLFLLDINDRSFSPQNVIHTYTNANVTIRNNKIVTTSDGDCTFRIETAGSLLVNYNTIWVSTLGNGTAAPLIRAADQSKLQFTHNILAFANRILFVASGSPLPRINAADWDYNLYLTSGSYLDMFHVGTTSFNSITDWRVGSIYDFHSQIDTYAKIPRAQYGNLKPMLTAIPKYAQGAPSYDTSYYLKPLSPIDLAGV